MWVWESSTATDTAARTALLDFAEAHQVNRLYLQGQSLLSTKANRTALASFLDAASARGIGTELMFGNHQWALKANHADAVALAQSAVSFAASTTGAKPVGVHFDVEPNTLDEWDTDMNGTAVQYLDMLDKLKAAVAGSGLIFAVDFNFSYGHRDVTRNGATKTLSHWIAKVVDRAAVMSYRDKALGSNGIVDISAESVADFTTESTPLVIGVNTLCNRPSGESFCTDGHKVLDQQLTAAAVAEKGTSVAGFAVHDYANYVNLKP
jgi:hypothetical protein